MDDPDKDVDENKEIDDAAILDDDLLDDDVGDDDLIVSSGKKARVHDDLLGGDTDTESLDTLAEDEDGILPEDEFEDKDLW